MNRRQSLCWCLWTRSHLSSLRTSPGRTANHLGGNGMRGQMETEEQEEEKNEAMREKIRWGEKVFKACEG